MILGVDPGTTAGFALINLDGTQVAIGSKKELSLSSLISFTISHGKVLIVGCDKFKIPDFVQDVATKLGAKVVSPQSDLRVKNKRAATANFKFSNAHEMDALAAAVFAHKKSKQLINRTKAVLEKEGRVDLLYPVLELVLKEGISIKHSFLFLTKKDKIDEVAAPKELKRDMLKVTSSLIETRQALRSFSLQNARLSERLAKLQKKFDVVKKKSRTLVNPKSESAIRKEYEKRTGFLKAKLENKKSVHRSLLKKFARVERCSLRSDLVAVPRVQRLSVSAAKKAPLCEVIFVDDPAQFSETALEIFKKKGVSFLICNKKPSKKLAELLPFPYTKPGKVVFNEKIIFVQKSWLSKQRSKQDVLEKVVSEYKKSRSFE